MNSKYKSQYKFVFLFLILLLFNNCKRDDKEVTPEENNNLDGVIAYYPFDTDVDDKSNNGNNGVLMNDAQIVTNGKIKGALKLDGRGDYVSVNRGLNLTHEFSFACWINPEVVNRSDAAIFAKFETNFYGPYDFYLAYDKPAFWISDGSGSFKFVQSNSSISANTWSHVAWTAKNNILKIYINGVFDKEIAIPNMTQNNDQVTIGRQAFLFNTSGNLEFKGMIDELRLYQRELKQEEVAEIYNLK